MRAGDLTEWITVHKATITPDPIGGQTETWDPPVVVAANIPSAVETLRLNVEALHIGQLRGAVTKRFRVRYRTDIDTSMRVVWETQTFEIGLVDQKRIEDETHLYCAEVM